MFGDGLFYWLIGLLLLLLLLLLLWKYFRIPNLVVNFC
jgi:hypothetical protein